MGCYAARDGYSATGRYIAGEHERTPRLRIPRRPLRVTAEAVPRGESDRGARAGVADLLQDVRIEPLREKPTKAITLMDMEFKLQLA